MSGLTTHVLDLVSGKPATGVRIGVARFVDGVPQMLSDGVTNEDGRVGAPLVAAPAFVPGVYELTFHIGDYFAGTSGEGPDARFLDVVPLRFSVADASLHYHVPLLVTPWAYSTYRGS